MAYNKVEVLVVGGGIGGLASALALRRAGREVRVRERAPEFGEVGAGLQLAPNATRVLRGWGLLDEVLADGVTPERLVMRDALNGSDLTCLDLADAERRFGAPYVVIHRSDLHALLVRACEREGVELVTGAEVLDIAMDERSVTVQGGGRVDTARAVIAADGLQSALRRRLSADEPIDSGYVAYRGTFPVSVVDSCAGVSLQDVIVYIGPGRHLVQYPLRQGQMLNQVAVFKRAADVAGRGATPAIPGDAPPDYCAELEAAFAGSCDQVNQALPFLWRDRNWPMFDREPITDWVDGRLALVGDAAHPMLQYLAQGACQALEDADCLARAVLAYPESGGAGERSVNWPAALVEYNRLRAPRTADVQRIARSWGDVWHCDGIARSMRNALLSDRRPDDYRYIDWLYSSAGGRSRGNRAHVSAQDVH